MSPKNKGIRIAGFRLTVEPMLPLVIIVIGWLLSERYFPQLTIGYYPYLNYILGGVASVMLTFSILFHELGHAIMADRLKLQIERIHLYLFGGMAELKHRPLYPRQELLIALSGPIASLMLSGLFLVIYQYFPADAYLSKLVIRFLIQINFLLAVFNLIPIFPLDGGRALRAVFWFFTRRYYKASTITLYTSYTLIIVILILGIIDLWSVNSGLEYIFILLAFYLAYTVWNGRSELLHQPHITDLVYDVDHSEGTNQLVYNILKQDIYFLSRMIVPVVHDNLMTHIIHGRHLHNESINQGIDPIELLSEHSTEFYTDVSTGDYIDITRAETFSPEISFASDFIPVTENGVLIGLCDANELRFWLLETHN